MKIVVAAGQHRTDKQLHHEFIMLGVNGRQVMNL